MLQNYAMGIGNGSASWSSMGLYADRSFLRESITFYAVLKMLSQ